MSGIDVLARFDHLSPVSIEELNVAAALWTRVDRKYVLTVAAVDALIDRLDPDIRVLDLDGRRHHRYESIYFDTPDLAAYHLSAWRRAHRFKVRTRTYVDTGECMFEVKLRNAHGNTVKHRFDYDIGKGGRLTDDALTFLSGFETLAPLRRQLHPTLITHYQRTTLLSGASRTTLDMDVTCDLTSDATCDVTCEGDDQAVRPRATFRDRVIVETKNHGGVGHIDRLLWSIGARPIAVSKYATGMAAIRPELPRNKWHRTLARHVTVEP